MCDFILFVDAPDEIRRERAQSRGWSDDEFVHREGAQWPVANKRTHATHVVSNSGSESKLRESIRNFWAENIAPDPAIR
jgi:dephospho-CoA kinase